MPFIKIDNPLVVYRFWYRYEMTAITTSRIFGKMLMFSYQQRASKISFLPAQVVTSNCLLSWLIGL